MYHVRGVKFCTPKGTVNGIFEYKNKNTNSCSYNIEWRMLKKFSGYMNPGDIVSSRDYNLYVYDISKRFPEYAL